MISAATRDSLMKRWPFLSPLRSDSLFFYVDLGKKPRLVPEDESHVPGQQ